MLAWATSRTWFSTLFARRAARGDLGEIKADLVEIKQRVGLLEGQYASLSGRVDRIAGDVGLIKRRLDPVEA